MSVRITSQVWESSGHKGNDLLLLLALADAANQEGVCWPKVSTLAKMTRLSERTVQRSLGTLKESGELVVLQGGFLDGKNQSSTYIVKTGRQDVTPLSDTPVPTASDGTVVTATGTTIEPSVEPSVEPSTASAASAASDGEHLPGLEPPAPAEPAAKPSDAAVAEVWAHYVAIFGDRLRVKELTPPRAKGIQKALAAVGDDVGTCKRAIDGLKSYRIKHPDGSKDVSLGVIFATGPHSRGNLTDQIEWWAEQAADQADVPPSVPSGHRARVMDLAVQVLKVERQPDNEAVRERGEQAQAILATRFKLAVISNGSGKLLRFEGVA